MVGLYEMAFVVKGYPHGECRMITDGVIDSLAQSLGICLSVKAEQVVHVVPHGRIDIDKLEIDHFGLHHAQPVRPLAFLLLYLVKRFPLLFLL